MNIPASVNECLTRSHGHFKGRKVAAAGSFVETVTQAGIPLNTVVKAVLLRSGKAYLMAIVRGDQKVDLPTINKLFKREFVGCSETETAALLGECDIRAIPPLPEAFGMRGIMDKSIVDMEQVVFATGVPGLLVSATSEDFSRLHENTWSSHRIVAMKGFGNDEKSAMRQKVQMVEKLPPMPGLAAELIRIRNNPYAHASELAAVIEQDPSLAAQLLRYATSPLYAYQGKLESVEQAIVRVLGMDFVLDIAFGLALGKAFNNPKDGPLGLASFWKHALYCASLTQSLCNAIEFSRRPPAGMGYLAGLLHNFGFLLLGHLFPTQFVRLNKLVEENPERDILELEREAVGVTHTEIGVWLMDAWDMPREIINAVSGHHDPEFSNAFSTYANLIYIANALLKRHGIGDAPSLDIPEKLLKQFDLTEEKLEVALGTVLKGREGLDFMVGKMSLPSTASRSVKSPTVHHKVA